MPISAYLRAISDEVRASDALPPCARVATWTVGCATRSFETCVNEDYPTIVEDEDHIAADTFPDFSTNFGTSCDSSTRIAVLNAPQALSSETL